MTHIDAAAHTRGTSQFVDDVPPPAGMLHAAICSSPLAHGRIRSLQLEDARAVDGVVAVLTAPDIPGQNCLDPREPEEPLLAEETVSYAGQPVAVVVGTSGEIARLGARMVRLEIEELAAVTDPKQAYEAGRIIGAPRTISLGDVEGAWAQCDLIAEGTCNIGGQEHVYLETQRSRAIPLEAGRLRIHSSTQGPFAVQKVAAIMLGVPMHRIEVDVVRLGGAFGGKEDQATPWACLAALAAWHTRQPVELVLNRAEDMRMTGKRHPYVSDFKIGVTREGKILAYKVWHYQNSGAMVDLSPAVLERSLLHSTNSYFVPNVRVSGACCRTNLPPNTAFRGFGGPQGMFVMESAIARAAELLGLPREELQRRNMIRPGDTFPFGQQVADDHASRAWDQAAETYDLPKLRREVETFNAAHFEIKKGLAVMPVCFGISFTTTHMNQAGSLVHVYTDGSVGLSSGGVEMGQGLSTNLVRVAARGFGIGEGRIRVESTNTTRVANMSPSAASSTTLLNGNAVLLAVKQIGARLRSVAANELGHADADKVTIDAERVLYDGKDTGLSWKQVVTAAYRQRVALSAHAFFATPGIWRAEDTATGDLFAYHVCGTAIVEVTLDCLRGAYDIDAVRIVHDLGRPLDDLVDRGQIEGGLAQGLGWMTMEDLQYDEQGQLLSSALATYKVPDAFFMPDEIEINFLADADSAVGPYGSKAVGEPPLMYGIGAFFALRSAMRAFRPDYDFPFTSPLTPERVLMALHAPAGRDGGQKDGQVQAVAEPVQPDEQAGIEHR